MGLTGVIYGAIVVAWAAYLVPQALRRHDQAARTRSIERFSSAMRVLSRRNGPPSGRMVVTPARQSGRLLTPSPTPAQPAESVEFVRPTRAAMRAAAARRRRVLIALLAATVATGAVGAFGVIAWWWFAAPLVSVLGFLVIARRQVRRADESYWQKAGQVRPAVSNVVRRRATRVDASHGSVKDEDTSPDEEPTIPIRAADLAAVADLSQEHVVAVSVDTADGGSLWDPLPVTLPTYVDKPVAKRSIRTIDLGAPGTWSSGHSQADSQTAAKAETASAPVEETARVVNG